MIRQLLFFLTLLLSHPLVLFAEGLNGSWEGKLNITPETGLRLVLNIMGAGTESPSVTMDSPDQGAYGIPMQIDFLNNDSICISMAQLMMSYKGKLNNDTIFGNFLQGGLKLPLFLTPKDSSLNRPQTPQPPFPYNSEEVSFPSDLDNASLYGTLLFPANANEETPFVILISGSGTQNRDEELFEHKPFAVIADYLARNGIGSLRYDDRGFDTSTGLSPNPTSYENALDAGGAIKFLKEKGFRKIGIIGHSEGGLIADMLAANEENINFVIEIGGPAVSGDSILVFQNEFLLRDGKLPEEYISMYITAMKGIFESLKDSDPNNFDETNYEIFSDKWALNPVVAPLAKNLKDNFLNPNPWIRYFINYDPLDDIKKITVPVLFIYGDNDTQVPPALNVPILEKEYPEARIKVYPELNHLMQHSKTGKVTEYPEIEETISPEVLNDIKLFILSF